MSWPAGRSPWQAAPDHHARYERRPPADLVERDFSATRPNQLWVADLTSVATWSGFVSVALVIDAFSRFLVAGRPRGRCAPTWP